MALLTPRVRRIILLTIPLGTAFTIVSVGSIRHPAAQSSRAADSQTLPGAAASTEQGLSQEPRDRGATYEWLESQATRVTVRFADIVATSERTADADIKTRLTDLVGNDVGTFKVHRVDAMNDELEFRIDGRHADSTGQADGRAPDARLGEPSGVLLVEGSGDRCLTA